jgi:hypothetical protein
MKVVQREVTDELRQFMNTASIKLSSFRALNLVRKLGKIRSLQLLVEHLTVHTQQAFPHLNCLISTAKGHTLETIKHSSSRK